MRRRLIVGVAAAALIVIAGAVWWAIGWQRTLAVRAEAEPVVTRYFESIAAGDTRTAYDMLCPEARSRSTFDEFEEAVGRLDIAEVRTGLAGTGPSSFLWPWSGDASVGVWLRVGRTERVVITRYIGMREEDGWRVCPGPKTPYLGREPR